MNQSNNSDYLARSLIEDTVFHIDEKSVRITCPSTIFVDVRNLTPLEREHLLNKYKSILQMAKNKRVKISYSNHYRKNINEKWDEYVARLIEYRELYVKIIEQAKIVQARGLHLGTRDDEELHKLQQLCWKHGESRHRDNIISLMDDISYELTELLNDLSDPDSGLIKICA